MQTLNVIFNGKLVPYHELEENVTEYSCFFKIIYDHVNIPMQASYFMPNIINTRENIFRFIQF